MIKARPKLSYTFGAFRLDVTERLLFHENSLVSLTPKAFDTLLALVQHNGHVLTTEELMQQVWPDSFVEGNNLAQNISTLRKILGRGAKFIETVPKRGYRFVAKVREIREEAPNPVSGDALPIAPHTRDARAGTPVGRATAPQPSPLSPRTEDTSQVGTHVSGMQHSGGVRPRAHQSPSPPFSSLPDRPPETMYARSGDVNIAYQVIGEAPIDLVFVMGWVSHLEYFWREPSFARFLLRLASFARLILFDKRGTGLSDRVPLSELPTLEQRMDDVRAVMDAVGSERAALCGVSEGGPMCSLFAATYPEKTLALVMIGTYAKRIRDDDYPWAPTTEQRQHFFEEMREQWGGPVGLEERAPSVAADPEFREWWATYLRMGASPGAALALTQMNAEIDVRQVLPSVHVPTLVIHRTGDQCLKVEEGRYVAEHIPSAKYVELPGEDHLPFVGDQDAILDEVEEFLTGVRQTQERDTVLATVLSTQIIDSNEHAQRLGDERWHALLNRLREQVRKEIEWFRGRGIDMLGDRPLAIFDGPARAIRCACAITESASRLGVSMRAGLHTGECEMEGLSGELPSGGPVSVKVRGIAPLVGAQVANRAAAREVLVSSTVKDLVAGSGIEFADKGVHTFADVPGDWRLFAVERGTVTLRR
ncbi:MAG TPA: alpha/beta fold hydrolase [Pyrinomonadaceae bacterium]|nr:alpha/beta fold hydrolase [Pyrinomonadaceae bacterium]